MGEQWAREWGWWCAATRAPETPAQRNPAIPLEGWGPDTRPRPTGIRGAGPDHPWDAATEEWLQAAPGPQTGWTGDVSSLVRTPVPPRIVLHAANVLQATVIRKWGHDTATVRWHPPEDGPPGSPWRTSKLGGRYTMTPCPGWVTPRGPCSSCSPPTLQPRCARSWTTATGCEWGGRQSRTAPYWPSSTGTPQTGANGIRWRPASPGATCIWQPPPRGAPRPAWDDLIAAFHDHWILPDDTWWEVQRKTLGRDYRRRVCASLLEIRDPLRQRWDDLWLRHLDPWSPPSHLPHTCRLSGECDTVSSAASRGANRCAPCAQVAACPWPEPPAGPRRRTEEEALHRRIEGAHTPSHQCAGPAGAALLSKKKSLPCLSWRA